jgi:hypothetical protein
MIYILEDNDERVRRFRAAAAVVAPGLPIRFWRSAPVMISDLVDALEYASLISLDHDLNPLPGDTADPGTGSDVAKLLGELIPCCPIIIHTSNGDRGTWMEGALSRAGWRFDRVYPFEDDWIEKQWAPLLRRRLRPGHAK